LASLKKVLAKQKTIPILALPYGINQNPEENEI
jgi:hypothetical protein